MTHDQRLTDLLDRQEISALQDRYWLGLGKGDLDMVVACFTPDARYGTAVGHAAIREWVGQAERLRDIVILRGAGSIDLAGDSATAETLALSVVTIGDGDRRRASIEGLHYYDELVRTPEGWRFSARSGRVTRGRAHDNKFQIDLVTAPLGLL